MTTKLPKISYGEFGDFLPDVSQDNIKHDDFYYLEKQISLHISAYRQGETIARFAIEITRGTLDNIINNGHTAARARPIIDLARNRLNDAISHSEKDQKIVVEDLEKSLEYIAEAKNLLKIHDPDSS